MNENHENRKLPVKQKTQLMKYNSPGYPAYPFKDNIHNKYQDEKDVNTEGFSEGKALNDIAGVENKKSGNEVESGNERDIPGC